MHGSHEAIRLLEGRRKAGKTTEYSGTPAATRTRNPRIRSPMLYPVELQAHRYRNQQCIPEIRFLSPSSREFDRSRKQLIIPKKQEHIGFWSGREDLNLRHPAPKAGALPGCATPRGFHHCRRTVRSYRMSRSRICGFGRVFINRFPLSRILRN